MCSSCFHGLPIHRVLVLGCPKDPKPGYVHSRPSGMSHGRAGRVILIWRAHQQLSTLSPWECVVSNLHLFIWVCLHVFVHIYVCATACFSVWLCLYGCVVQISMCAMLVFLWVFAYLCVQGCVTVGRVSAYICLVCLHVCECALPADVRVWCACSLSFSVFVCLGAWNLPLCVSVCVCVCMSVSPCSALSGSWG